MPFVLDGDVFFDDGSSRWGGESGFFDLVVVGTSILGGGIGSG